MSLSINLDIAKRLDITCRRGDTFNLEFLISDALGVSLDIESPSKYTFKMEVRETDTSSASIITTNNSNSDGFNIFGFSDGRLVVVAAAAAMALAPSGVFVYDLQATNIEDDSVQTWFFGIFKINEDVTL